MLRTHLPQPSFVSAPSPRRDEGDFVVAGSLRARGIAYRDEETAKRTA